MQKTPKNIALTFFVLAGAGILLARIHFADGGENARAAASQPGAQTHGLVKKPWKTSRLAGSPEPAPPFRNERLFPKVNFKNPLLCDNFPGSNRIVIGEQSGKIYSFPRDPNCSRPDLFIDLTTELKTLDPKIHKQINDGGIGLTFHPKFAQNRYCYICYILDSQSGVMLADGTRVSRFTVLPTDPPRIDPASEKILLTFQAGGHNGGCLVFGNDGCLYISTGDGSGPNPPDRRNTGQDISDLLSSILRIDVDHEDKGLAYRVPPDNPFVHTPGARPEIWAYGVRNPWKMTFDRATGDLWAGDVGLDTWEMVYRIQRGGNYGWSIMEGRLPVYPERKRGPTPILPPLIDFPHSIACSITGGYVYRGRRYPELAGAYICGDYVTGRIWATHFQGDKILQHRELAQTGQRIVAFGEDPDGELYYINHDGTDCGLYRLVPQNRTDKSARFPRKLSDTGLFADTARAIPADGVFPFSVIAGQWADYATAERWVALPGSATIKMFDQKVAIPNTYFSSRMHFPEEAVLARTLSLEMVRGQPHSRRKLETQILLRENREWNAYTYAWNDAQTDADLVGAAGMERTFVIPDPQAPGGQRRQTWRYHSRAECLRCHSHWNGNLAFSLLQLDRDCAYGPSNENQLTALIRAGVITHEGHAPNETYVSTPNTPKLCNPYDPLGDLNRRARSYLHANCSHCHDSDATDFRGDQARNRSLGVRPNQGTFNIHNAAIIAPGDPYRSILYYRVSKLGGGHMPHIGSSIIDAAGVPLLHDWIQKMPPRADESMLLVQLRELDEPPPAGGTPARPVTHSPNDAKSQSAARADLINKLLSTTTGALLLAHATADEPLSPGMRQQAIALGHAHAEPEVRDLFERFLPDDQRVKKLGTDVKPETILKVKGDVARGKLLFFANSTVQCKSCHRIGTQGSTLGPDLSAIGKKLDRSQILESILEPSKKIDPQYVQYVVETQDGQVHTGLVVEKSTTQIVLKNQGDKETRIPAGKVAVLAPMSKSIMPELLLRDMTAEQVADLLAYLGSLK